jgi:adenine/guanine phosphoribosyltransferase-like PRPP-binding protein
VTKKKKRIYVSSHVQGVFELDKTKRLIPRAAKLLKDVEFDAIAFRGMSGCLFAAPLAYKMGKPMLMVRKPGMSHTTMTVEGDKTARTYIIVDDFLDTGRTVQDIIKALEYWTMSSGHELHCVGVMTASSVMRTYKDSYGSTYPNPYKLASPEKAVHGDDNP